MIGALLWQYMPPAKLDAEQLRMMLFEIVAEPPSQQMPPIGPPPPVIVKPSITVAVVAPACTVTTVPPFCPSRIVSYTRGLRSSRVPSSPTNPPYNFTPALSVMRSL